MYSSNFLSKGTYDQYNDPALIYYSADIINNQSTISLTSSRNAPARFQEVRSTPIINNASNFEVAVISANLDGVCKTLPIFIPQIDLSQTNPNNTVYEISISNGVQEITDRIVFVPVSTTPQPSNIDLNEPFQDLSTDYYYLYNYQQFVDLINLTIFNITQQFTTIPPTNAIPYMTYDAVSGLFTIYNPVDVNQDPLFNIYFNKDLFNLFSSFNYNLYTLNANTPYQIKFASTVAQVGSKQYTNPFTTVNFTYTTQQYNTTNNLWCPVASIVISTTLLPVLNESTSAPIVYKSSNINSLSTSSNAFTNNILEFNPFLTSASDITNVLQYIPTAEFRYKSLTGSNTPINNIDLNIYWRNRLNNELNQLYMPNFSNLSIKLLFRRKN